MREVEIKILEIDGNELRQRLLEIGAVEVFSGTVRDRYYDFEDRRLMSGGKLLRIREEGERDFLLTWKGPPRAAEAKVREEMELEVGDGEILGRILARLGLGEWLILEKQRTLFRKGEVRFCMDRYLGEYSHIPEFLEIEAQREDDVFRYAEILGFRPEDCLPWSFDELRRYYEAKQNEGL